MKSAILLGKKKHKSSDGEGMKNIDKSKRINFALKTEDYVRRFQDFQKIHHYGKFSYTHSYLAIFLLFFHQTANSMTQIVL